MEARVELQAIVAGMTVVFRGSGYAIKSTAVVTNRMREAAFIVTRNATKSPNHMKIKMTTQEKSKMLTQILYPKILHCLNLTITFNICICLVLYNNHTFGLLFNGLVVSACIP